MHKFKLQGFDEELADEILDTVETPIALLAGDGAILRFNHACEALTEYSEADAVGAKVWEFLILDEEIEAVRQVFRKTCSQDVPTHYTNYWRTKSGGRRLLKWSNRTIRRPTGDVAMVIATALDITDLRSIEHDLTESRAFLRSVIDASPIAVVTIDGRGRILTFSREAERTFGRREKDVVGEDIQTLMPASDGSLHHAFFDRYLETKEKRIIGRSRQVKAKRADGEEFPALLHVSEFIDGDRIFVGFIEDISEREETERRLSETQFQLHHANRVGAMGEIATSIAHELNQPLTAAASLAGAVALNLRKRDCPHCQAMLPLLDDTVGEIRRASEIIYKMREFVRKRKTAKSSHSVNKIVEDAAALAIIGADADGVEVRWDLASDAGEILLDRIQIQQVVVNLIRNAIDAMAGVKRRVLTIATKRLEGGVAVSIADTGPGISRDMAKRLFDPFVSEKADGLGVGLAISKAIIDAHQGGIRATNLEERGCVFTFQLPATGNERVGEHI